MKQTVLVLVLSLAVCACAVVRKSPAPVAGAGETAAVPESEIGLAPGRIEEVPTPPPLVENTSEPGERPAAPRVYPGAPPTIPHGIAAFLPITRDENACLECHAVKEKEEGGPTPIPQSHYVDLRNAPDRVRPEIAGARYRCVTCHAVRTDAPLPVGSRFGS